MNEILYVVIPCYKEEAVLPETAKRMKEKMTALIGEGKISADSRVLFVNDGSKDKTWDIIRELHEGDSLFSGVNLSRNRGHQNALLAGLTTALSFADVTVSMDADLQDDINAIDKMLDEYHNGYDVVYGVRSNRETDTAIKRFTAEMFYKFMKLMGAEVIFNHADYRLMSKRALEGLMEFKEVNLFLRGIVPQIGYPFTTVEYERAERFAGESKYPFKKMLSFAFDGISSFSVKPIKLVLHTGIIVFLISIIMLIIVLIQHFTGNTTTGWSSLMGSLWLLGGIQLISIGLIGEYVGKVYSESKARPRFIIQDILNTAPMAKEALPAEDKAEKAEKKDKKDKRESGKEKK